MGSKKIIQLEKHYQIKTLPANMITFLNENTEEKSLENGEDRKKHWFLQQ